ncbi:MAG TPA: methyltransferase domain-containing protein [Longimicrobiales bacterium]
MALTLDLPCPACGGRASTQLATREDVLEEVERLWAFHGRRLRPQVPPRQLMDRVVFSQDPALRLATCDGCGTVLREPREGPDAIARRYAAEQPDERLLASLFTAQRRAYGAQARRLTRVLGRAGSGLEVGSYVGAFLAAARAGGWRFEGVDVNPAAVAFACGKGMAARAGALEQVDGSRRFDAVAIWNCFEQLPDPRAAARQAAALLVPGGVLALRVPNGACYRALRRMLAGPLAAPAAALLALNNLLSFPYRHGFTPHSLQLLLRGTGLTPVRVLGDVLVPTADRWTRGWAALEERVLKGGWRAPARLVPAAAPWLELYARKR